MNTNLDMITGRVSCRAFTPEPVEKSVLEKIFSAAGQCPSYTNTQPWEAVVVQGEKKDELSRMLLSLAKNGAPSTADLTMPETWPPEMARRSQEHGARRLATLGFEREDKAEREKLRLMNFEFYGAPCAVILCMDRQLGHWSLYDMGLFSQNLVLSAHCLGVSTCIQASVVIYARQISEFLGLDTNKKIIACIAMGYQDPAAKLNHYRSVKKKPEDYLYCLE